MKHLFSFLFCLITTISFSQAIGNGGFEYWNSSTTDMPVYYPQNSNPTALILGLPANTLKIADPQQGTYAIQLNTVANATDTLLSYITNGDPGTGAGGIPYNQHPVTLTGYYKSNIMPGDTGFILVIFKEAGVVLSYDGFAFYGVQNAYTPFSIALTIPALANPDSIVFAAASSNAFIGSGIPGSMLQLDNLTFTGVASQPIMMNGSFENWTSVNTSRPIQWSTAGDIVNLTTDAHSGSYALTLNTFAAGPNYPSPSYASNGYFPPNAAPAGGRPYSLMTDTLFGWYKFIPAGIDSATIAIETTFQGTSVGGNFMALAPASVYTFFAMPFSSFSTPDTLRLLMASSFDDINPSNIGSVFKLDDLYLKSSLTGTGPEISWNTFGKVSVYPNPSNEDCWIEFDNNGNSPLVMTITDELGKTISETIITEAGHQQQHIDTSVLAKGSYILTLTQDGKRTNRKIVVQ
ncbi:MAG: T9SS type A sorting domain-containing protein [Bacteroidota bacterium]|nr:T9SS type A sorting domain-containing protein [Bacteroidota bacterium]